MKTFFRSHQKYSQYLNKNTGRLIKINDQSMEEDFGKDKLFAHTTKKQKILKLATAEYLPEIIENAVRTHEDYPNIHDNKTTLYDYYELENVIVDNEPHTVYLAVEKKIGGDLLKYHLVDINRIPHYSTSHSKKNGLSEMGNSNKKSLPRNKKKVKKSNQNRKRQVLFGK